MSDDDLVNLIEDLLNLNPEVSSIDFRQTVLTLRKLWLIQNSNLLNKAKQSIQHKQTQIDAELRRKTQEDQNLRYLCEQLFWQCFDVIVNGERIKTPPTTIRYRDHDYDVSDFFDWDFRADHDPRVDLNEYLNEIKQKYDGTVDTLSIDIPSQLSKEFREDNTFMLITEGKSEVSRRAENVKLKIELKWRAFPNLARIKKLTTVKLNEMM